MSEAKFPDQYYLELAEKWLAGTITPEEKEIYARWYNQIDPDISLEIPASVARNAEVYRSRLFQKINERRRKPAKALLINRWRYAAAVLIVVGGAVVYYSNTSSKQLLKPQAQQAIAAQRPILPGGNKAILTLAGGKVIVLDSAANGILASEGNSRVKKLANGRLSYESESATDARPAFNTLATPKGGQYQLTLPDSTQIWLNAASSITYPTAFTGKERAVTITGEAYFEIAKDKDRPFVVYIGTQKNAKIEVLGTHFNINAYTDEQSIRATLLEGRIRVDGPSGSISPRAGEQVQASTGGILSLHRDINTDEVMAWKNGLFDFEDADIRTVMRQLARWYDVDVAYEGHITEDRFDGKLSKDQTIESSLHILEKNQVHFRIEGRKIIVVP